MYRSSFGVLYVRSDSRKNVQDDNLSLTLQLNLAEEKSSKLQAENEQLVDRWMARMGKEAEAMNDASKFS